MSAPAPRDRYGLPLSTASPVAAERYVEGVDRLLSQDAGIEESLRAAVEADPGFALAWADLAFFQAYQRRPADARQTAKQLEGLDGGISARERRHAEIVRAFVGGDAPRADALVAEHLAEHPRDAVAGQIMLALVNGSGRLGRCEELLVRFDALAPALGDDWWYQGARSFALHETEQYDEARRCAERALAGNPRTANGAHSLAHVFYETSDHPAGAGFLQPWLADYDRRAPFLSHLSWHLALFELASGHEDRAFEVYRRSISPAVVQNRNTLEDSASFLWRYQIYGCAAGELPWSDVCAFAARTAPNPGMAFTDAHAALAYAAMQDEPALTKLIDGLRTLAANGNTLAADVTLPLAFGLRAFAEANYDETIRRLESLAPHLVRLGGSHAQREVFEDTLLQSYMRTCRWEQAEALLRKRLDQRSSQRDLVWLEEVVRQPPA